jgi:GNAT superfamily N-acetyltransferase
LRLANTDDKKLVVDILTKSFKCEPHTNWLIENSTNQDKMTILMEYVFDETIQKGEIYISDDSVAVALWDFERVEKYSLSRIRRDIVFLKALGLNTINRCTETEGKIRKNYPRKYCHLYLLGVLPEYQGKGYSSTLMNYMIEKMKINNVPIYLETATTKNKEIYSKKGFQEYAKLEKDDIQIYLMRKSS